MTSELEIALKKIDPSPSNFDFFRNPAGTSSPVITSHPRMDILNSELAEAFLAHEIQKVSGNPIIWIPYTYDLGFQPGPKRIKNPSATYFEDDFIHLCSKENAGNRPLCLLKGYNAKDVKRFIEQVKKRFQASYTLYQQQVNAIGFGHPLFDLKRGPAKKQVRIRFEERLSRIENILNGSLGLQRLSDQFTQVSAALLEEIVGIKVAAIPIDRVLAEDEELVESILLNYGPIFDAVGSPIKIITKDNERIDLTVKNGSFYSNQNLSAEEIRNKIKHRRVTIRGDLFFAILNHYGLRLNISGTSTINFYDNVMQGSSQISQELGERFDMGFIYQFFPNFSQVRSVQEVAAAIRIGDKVGGRNLVQKGSFKIPQDIADHLGFVAGTEEVPDEYKSYSTSTSTAAMQRYQNNLSYLKELLHRSNQSTLTAEDKEYLSKKLRCTDPNEGYVRRTIEEKIKESQKVLSGLQRDAKLERVFLGGTHQSIFRDGVIAKSQRSPGLITLFLLGFDIVCPEYVVQQMPNNPYGLMRLNALNEEDQSSYEFSDPAEYFSTICPQGKIPPILRES